MTTGSRTGFTVNLPEDKFCRVRAHDWESRDGELHFMIELPRLPRRSLGLKMKDIDPYKYETVAVFAKGQWVSVIKDDPRDS